MIKIAEIRTCDMPHDKPRNGETVRFDIDSRKYELELCPKDKRDLTRVMDEFIPHARKVVSDRVPHRSRDRNRPVDIRAWARASGLTVNAHGRIPVHIVRQYEARETPA